MRPLPDADPAVGAQTPPRTPTTDPARKFSLFSRGKKTPDPEPAVAWPRPSEADPLAGFASESTEPQPGPPTRPSRMSWMPLVAILAVSVAVVEGAYILGQYLAARAPQTGTVRVVSRPAGAELFVDGTSRGPAPVTLTLPAGAHALELRLGSDRRQEPITVAAGAESVHSFDLAPPAAPPADVTGALELTSDPSGARVTIDGHPRGVTPLLLTGLTAGPHDIVITSGTTTVRKQVRLSAGTTTLVMTPIGSTAAAPQPGWVRVESPVPLDLYQDDRLIGTSAVDRIMLPAGAHGLRMVNRTLNYEARELVQIAGGQTRVLRPTLPTGALSINALPWAEVWVDGERRGETPLGNLQVSIGNHEIVFRHPQYGERRRSATVTTGGITRVGVDLRQ